MAYMTQENKKHLSALAKAVLPKGWKATFAVRHHSGIVCTITEAPASILEDYLGTLDHNNMPSVNRYHMDRYWKGKTLEALSAILQALGTGNHDNSDIMSDYFDIGWYVDLSFGKWNKPTNFVKELVA